MLHSIKPDYRPEHPQFAGYFRKYLEDILPWSDSGVWRRIRP